MNPIKTKYKEKYDSIEPYLVLKMQIAVITALIITIIATILDPLILVLNVLTLSLLTHSLYQANKNFQDQISKYTAIFTSLYAAAILAPLAFTRYEIRPSPGAMDTVLIILIVILIIIALLKIMVTSKGVKAKVTLANKETAVIEPEYDLITGIKPGKYVVNNKGAKEGDRVIVNLNKPLFQRPKPKEIKEIIK